MVKRAEGLAWRTIDSETFVVDLHAKVMFGLNAAGGAVWQAIVEGQPLHSVVRRLAMAEDRRRPVEAVRARVHEFVRTLADAELVELDAPLSEPVDLDDEHLQDFQAPAIVWQEDMVAYAQNSSCLFDPLNCPAGPVA